METIKLRRPLRVNGEDYAELKCDLDAVTVDGFMRAEVNAKKDRPFAASVAEMDYGFQLQLGFEGVKAAMPEVDDSDLARITGPDLLKVYQAGRDFLTASGEPASEGSTSDDASEPTPTSSRPASKK